MQIGAASQHAARAQGGCGAGRGPVRSGAGRRRSSRWGQQGSETPVPARRAGRRPELADRAANGRLARAGRSAARRRRPEAAPGLESQEGRGQARSSPTCRRPRSRRPPGSAGMVCPSSSGSSATRRARPHRDAAGRAIAALWAQDQLIAEEEQALVRRGYAANWSARRRYPRAIRSEIPITVTYGLPFLQAG